MSNKNTFTIFSLNIGNARRDNRMGFALFKRFKNIINMINKHNPDFVALSEAGRPSVDGEKEITWHDYFIPEIEKNTNLKFVSLGRNNDNVDAMGICIFAKSLEQVSSCDRHEMCETEYGNLCMVTKLKFKNYPDFTFTKTHLSVDSNFRMLGLNYVLSIKADLICGDFNAFPDDNVDEMCEQIEKNNFKIVSNKRLTFIPFPYDEIRQHPKITTFVPTSDTKCWAFTPLDYALENTGPYATRTDVLHPVTGDIICETDNQLDILKEVIEHDKNVPFSGRGSDHFALLLTITEK